MSFSFSTRLPREEEEEEGGEEEEEHCDGWRKNKDEKLFLYNHVKVLPLTFSSPVLCGAVFHVFFRDRNRNVGRAEVQVKTVAYVD